MGIRYMDIVMGQREIVNVINDFQISNLKTIICMCLVYMYVCALYVCLVPLEARRWCLIPWNYR